MRQDYLYNEAYNKNGGPRCATVIAYLTDVEQGGETVCVCVCVVLDMHGVLLWGLVKCWRRPQGWDEPSLMSPPS